MSRVKALAEALEGSEVNELDVTESGLRVVLKRRLDAPILLPATAHPAARRAGRARAASEPPAPSVEQGVALVAPLTGVFYSMASPSAPPFVQQGETVQAGQVACLIEAMKVFNEIKTEVAGTVTTISAQNGQLVQRGDVLLRIRPL